MNNMNEAIPPPKISTSKQPLLDEIKRLNEVIEHMYSQAEMDEVMAINTVLEEEIERLGGKVRVEIQRLKNIS